MAPLLSYQPFKALSTLLFIASVPPYLAGLSLLYIFRECRPIPAWTIRTAVGTAGLRLFYIYATRIRLRPFFANPSKLKDRYVLVHPGPSELYIDVLETNDIKPAPMPAIWFPEAPARSDIRSRKVVIHFQGGAFVTATDPEETGKIPARIFTDKLGTITFYAQYRLSRTDATRFPAALQDVVSFYYYVLDQGVDPRNIIISGDSAGGNLAIGLLRYIEETDILPRPRGVMLWSPWLDVSQDALDGYVKGRKFGTDFPSLGLLQWGTSAYEPESKSEKVDRFLRPVVHPFSTRVPIFVNAGTAELLYDEITTFTRWMENVEGNRILYVETKHAPHDILLAGSVTGFVKEAENAAEQASAFFDGQA